MFNALGVRLTYSLNHHARQRNIDRNYLDYIRLSSLELAAQVIKQASVGGAVAELGVYKGKFARYINGYFPDRKLYLFDTFEGFNKKDIESEIRNNFSGGDQDFSNTSVESVLQLMPHRDQCIVCKGFFPDSAKDVNESFCFVSIDTDLYDPIYSGLQYFYPRLQKGGYIFVHDYNNDQYKGASQAVIKFCRENNISYMLLPDSCGTAVIVK